MAGSAATVRAVEDLPRTDRTCGLSSRTIPNGARSRRYGPFAGRSIHEALVRDGVPSWTEADFADLLRQLQYAGYGWLRPDGVRAQLEAMAPDWRGIPALPIA